MIPTADLRMICAVLVRERIKGGDSDEQVSPMSAPALAICPARPPLESGTLLLWGGPLLILLLGGGARPILPQGPTECAPPLSAEERRRLAALLGEGAER